MISPNLPFMSSLLRYLLFISLPCLASPAGTASSNQKEPPVATNPEPDQEEDGADEEDAPGARYENKPDPAADKFWQAIPLLESNQSSDQAAGRALLQEASDLEFSHAQVLLGNCHLSGSYGFARNPRKAVNLLLLAAERGNAFAQVSLGTCYATGTGTRTDAKKAQHWLMTALAPEADYSRPMPPESFTAKAAAASNSVAGELANDPVTTSQASAHFMLAQILVRQNQPAEAQKHYVAAATAGPDGRSGVYQAAVEAALNYAFGRGIPRDATQAREMLEQSRRLNARMGVNLIHNYVQLKIIDDFAVADIEESVTEAGAAQQSTLQLQIAQTLGNRKSKDYDPAEAARWYEIAAENGQVWAMLSLALLHAEGELGAPDPTQAFRWFEKAGDGDKPKHYLGAANLAICLREGLGTPRDEKRAAAIFAKHRDIDIICYLGTIGQAPREIVSFEEALALNEKWAKDKNDAHAQFLLGLRYSHGSGVPVNLDHCLRWLKRSAKSGHGAALRQLGWFYQFNPWGSGFRDLDKAAKAATEAYQAAAKAGDIDGMANYANSLYAGFGVEKDEAKAIATYERCLQLDPNHARSHANLGGIYNNKLIEAAAAGTSIGTDEWTKKMLWHYEASMKVDQGLAAIALGDLHYDGRLIKQDLNQAYSYYEQAVDFPLHKAAAHFRLGWMHEHGQGVPVTYTEAAYHYRLAALEGQVPALRRLVDFYLTGTGVSQDFDRATYWLGLMVRLNQNDALPAIADVLIKRREYDKAAKLLKALINSNDPIISGHAHERLSLCYRTGSGVKKNLKRAERHLKIAVEKGNGNALRTIAHRQFEDGNIDDGLANLTIAARTSGQAAFNLGQIYYFGTHTPADRPKAMEYLRKAVSLNYGDAHYFLAGLCWNREPVAPSLDEAIDLALKAENLGHPNATQLREMLEKRRQQETAKPEENSRTRSS